MKNFFSKWLSRIKGVGEKELKTDDTTTNEETTTNRQRSKESSEKEKKAKQKTGKRISLLIFVAWFILSSIIIFTIIKLLGIKNPIILPVTIIVTNTIFMIICIRNVSQENEYTICLFGKWFHTWESGLHFLFPIVTTISSKVYLGDQITTLYMDDQERNGEKDSSIDFTNASSPVIARLYFRIYSSHRATFKVDNFMMALREKIDSALRAYLGELDLDKALMERSNIDHEKIITIMGDEASIFNDWGVEIRGLAITDIELPEDVVEIRQLLLRAEKEKEAALYALEQARIEVETEELKGSQQGKRLKKISTDTELPIEDVITWDIQRMKYEAYGKAEVLIGGDQTGTAAGAGMGAAAQIGASAMNKT